MTNIISSERDELNKRLIMSSFSFRRQVFREHWHGSEHQRMVENGTPDARAAFLARQNKKFAVVVVIIAVLVVAWSAVPSKSPVPKPVPPVVITNAGSVVGLQLHETALSTATTVITTAGTFQVRGAVSAAPGDVTALKKERSEFGQERTSLCVKSQAKPDCYNLL